MQTCLAFGSGNRIPFSCGGALDAPSACSGVRRRRFTRDVDHLKNLIKENFYKFSARRSFATNWIKVFLGNKLSIIS
jgi:hypothetical protein